MEQLRKEYESLVLNWKLRLVLSALLSIMSLALVIGTASGVFIPDFDVLDQTIVAVAVCVIVIPVYLIIADLPEIDEHTIANLLNSSVPELKDQAQLVLAPAEELEPDQQSEINRVIEFFDDQKLYRYLPMRPITQSIVILISCLTITAAILSFLA